MQITKYILDSGDISEYKEIKELATTVNGELWGGTTNPSLIAKRLAGKKVTPAEAFALQKAIVLEITKIVPGAVSAEVYADTKTTPEQMIQQGREIAKWHERVVVKLPTSLAGLKARSTLRKEKVPINNTLVFSQEQIYAICLQEKILQATFGPITNPWPCFISPFVGRIDDIGENGIDLIRYGMELKKHFTTPLWMLEASVRSIAHMAKGIQIETELITAPAPIYKQWLMLKYEEKENAAEESEPLIKLTQWEPSEEIKQITTLDQFDHAIATNILDIRHELTDKGITKFAQDWQSILVS